MKTTKEVVYEDELCFVTYDSQQWEDFGFSVSWKRSEQPRRQLTPLNVIKATLPAYFKAANNEDN